MKYADLLAGDTVAMGDRAGSFAYAYDGPVYQLEGLVNGVEYLEVLKQGDDLRQHLCAKGISIFVDYEPITDHYDTMNIPVFLPTSSSFPGPVLTVYRAEEIASYDNSAIFSGVFPDTLDYRIYAWRLAC
ncbi:MAG: hypothetical protein L3J33_08755 [Rhodobacteraceae bacterium]|nr:hypothetical protein [Paracoccaceae bacterium]